MLYACIVFLVTTHNDESLTRIATVVDGYSIRSSKFRFSVVRSSNHLFFSKERERERDCERRKR